MTVSLAAKPACVDLELGESSADFLGRLAPPKVEAHRRTCFACELERIAFGTLDQHAADPSPELEAWLQALALRTS